MRQGQGRHSTSFGPTKWIKFKSHWASIPSLILFLSLFFLSLTAEVWSNSKPILLHYQNKYYFPIYREYHPTLFGRDDIYVMDYRVLKLGVEDWALWPFNRWDPYESNSKLSSYPAPPSAENIFGTDDRGRDVFARVLYGFRFSLSYALGVWFFSYLLGTLIGSIMGYFGGWVDLLGMRFVEVMDSLPTLLIIITLISIYSPSLNLLIFISVIFGWTSIATYMRAEFLALRKREFVESARLIGLGSWRIIFRHLLPNALTPIITFSPFSIATSILTLTNMDYLGLGLPAPTPSWGELLSQAQKYITIAEWLVWWPSLFLVLMLISLINIGLAVRDSYDSKIN